jgi:hypothetical protein
MMSAYGINRSIHERRASDVKFGRFRDWLGRSRARAPAQKLRRVETRLSPDMSEIHSWHDEFDFVSAARTHQ